MLAVDLRARQGGEALHVEQVLDGIRHARQRRQHVPGGPLRIHRIGFGARPLEGAAGEGVDFSIGRFDARDGGFAGFARRQFAGRDARGQGCRLHGWSSSGNGAGE
jgi:hypothetical protein